MIKIIGLTGGIGSGKTTVSKLFEQLGVSIYSSDIRAKAIMNENIELRKEIINLLGSEAYNNGKINKSYIAHKIFTNPILLKKQNDLVHPFVVKDFNEWKIKQTGPFCIKEAAILFESGTYKDCNYIIVVTAPDKLRIARVMKRENCSQEEVMLRISRQLQQEELIQRADFVITNDSDISSLRTQVENIFNQIKNKD